jgi:outer membrane lipoprotein LolB
LKAWLACLAAALLSACAEFPSPSDAQLGLGPPLPSFTAEGRISLRRDEQRDHVRFRWEHSPQRDVVLLMSPLGQGLAELTRDAAGARLLRPHQPVVAAESLAQLVQRVVGIPLPLEALADWLRGSRPALSGTADGWQVAILDTSVFRLSRVVRVLQARRESEELKLIVDSWDAPE